MCSETVIRCGRLRGGVGNACSGFGGELAEDLPCRIKSLLNVSFLVRVGDEPVVVRMEVDAAAGHPSGKSLVQKEIRVIVKCQEWDCRWTADRHREARILGD